MAQSPRDYAMVSLLITYIKLHPHSHQPSNITSEALALNCRILPETIPVYPWTLSLTHLLAFLVHVRQPMQMRRRLQAPGC
jgi:hypothetical protein